MRREDIVWPSFFVLLVSFVVLFLAGCSTAPIADFLDFFKPGRLEPEETPPYGGVCGAGCAAPPPAGPLVPVPAAQGPITPSGPSPIAPPFTPGPPQ